MPRWYITVASFVMKKHLVILAAFALVVFCGCNKITLSGHDITKEFSINGTYTELEVSNGFDVTVNNAVSQITVTTDENVMPKVVVEKIGEKLKIYLKPLTVNTGLDLKVEIPYNVDLRKVNLSGASEFHSDYGLAGGEVDVDMSGKSGFYSDIYADEVDIDMSGGSEFFGDIDADQIDMDLSGSSSIEGYVSAIDLDVNLSGGSDAILEGEVVKLEIELSGASRIVKKVFGNRYALACDYLEGSMSGGSEAYIHCDSRVCVDLSGASNLYYTGNGISSGCGSTTGGSSIIHHPEGL